jgi:prepilin-type N-terminal cleavage/methylation domain-containing protein
MNNKACPRAQGFTLIEIIVAIGIFTAVITMALATFLNISDIQRKAGALRAINDNLNFALEIMSREIRTGKNYCSSSCDSSSFNLINSQNDNVVYRLNNNSIERSSDSGSTFLRLTSPEIKIDDLIFIVKGEAVGDQKQPMVTIILNGSSIDKKAGELKLNIQTTVSQRKLDS